MPTDPRNLGPDGKDVEVSGEHLDQATACLSTATARRDEQAVAQAIANAEARGFRAIDRPRGRELDHNTTAHQIARDLAGQPLGLLGENQREQAEQRLRGALADAYTAGRADQLAEQTPAALVLTVEELAEVRDLCHAMPYGGSMRTRHDAFRKGPADGVELVEMLRGMQRVLQVVGRQQSAAFAELEELRTQRAAVRAYFGDRIDLQAAPAAATDPVAFLRDLAADRRAQADATGFAQGERDRIAAAALEAAADTLAGTLRAAAAPAAADVPDQAAKDYAARVLYDLAGDLDDDAAGVVRQRANDLAGVPRD